MIDYHPGKANMIVKALSRKSATLSYMNVEWELLKKLCDLGWGLKSMGDGVLIAINRIKPTFI